MNANEPVFIILGCRNDGIERPMPITVTQWPNNHRAASYQFASDPVLEAMGSDQTSVWWGEWDGEEYRLRRPLTEIEMEHALQDMMAEVPF